MYPRLAAKNASNLGHPALFWCGEKTTTRATADPSAHHPQAEKRLGSRSLRMTNLNYSLRMTALWAECLVSEGEGEDGYVVFLAELLGGLGDLVGG
jgi:hypothetical protein